MATFLTGIKDTWNILPNKTENIICEISLRLIIYSFYICVSYKCGLKDMKNMEQNMKSKAVATTTHTAQ